ncbi:hypothetical protein DUI87_13640 [Hirundo rustica rustica]|uniref:Reverse transcriptase/retrotransposon-derived protein RNase H-like domain-containing protein n=1 Tax=Hirundo rustica rustica TaxID=333673 RepID=A0A3M0K9I3_HIRRU|nr:hypothetical protein DUI87_13640 [Hirundo rustica rustica]
MKREDMEETVLDMAKKLRAYADAVHGPTHARIAAVETRLQKLEDKIDENHKRLREEIRKDLLQISAVQIRGSGTQRRCSPGRERGYTPRAELWFFLRDCGENMNRWDGKSTAALAQRIKQEIAHAVALGPVRTGPDVKNVLYSAGGSHGLSWSLWQKVPGETRGRPLGFWSRSYRGTEANYTPTEKEILAAYEGVQAALEVIGTEAQLLLAPRLPVLGWMFKGAVPSTHHATDATWSKWIALITQRACMGKLNRPGILEIITNWPEGENFGLTDEEQEQVTRAKEASPYNQLPAEETHYALFTDGSCRIVGMNRKWKAAVWSPTQQVIHDCETCAAIKQAKRVKPLWYGRRWSKYKYGEAWQIDYITLPQTHRGKRYVLTMVEATTG